MDVSENDVKEFSLYYINIAYFRIPSFRNKLLEIISTNIGDNEKFEKIIERKKIVNLVIIKEL